MSFLVSDILKKNIFVKNLQLTIFRDDIFFTDIKDIKTRTKSLTDAFLPVTAPILALMSCKYMSAVDVLLVPLLKYVEMGFTCVLNFFNVDFGILTILFDHFSVQS